MANLAEVIANPKNIAPVYNGIPLMQENFSEDQLKEAYKRYQYASKADQEKVDDLSTFLYAESNLERYMKFMGNKKKNHRQVINLDDTDANPQRYIRSERNISLEGFFSDLDIQRMEFDDKPVQNGFVDPTNNRWNSLYVINGRNYREKCETLIIKGDSVYLAFINEDKYSIPGGSSEPNRTLSEQAANECKEEARILINNINYVMSYDYDYTEKELKKQPKYMVNIPEDKRWVGKHIHLFTAEFVGPYKGYVEKADRDYLFINKGKFYNIKKIFKKLRPEHQLALREYMEVKNNASSS